MNYNNNKNYNYSIDSGGMMYNSATIQTLIRIFDVFSFLESRHKIYSQKNISESVSIIDKIVLKVFNAFLDELIESDYIKLNTFFSYIESERIKDTMGNIFSALHLYDKQNVLDEFDKLNALLSKSQIFDFNEKNKIDAMTKIADKFNLKDVSDVLAFFTNFDSFFATDKEPRKAISDFLIGHSDGFDNAYDWVFPFEMKIDWRSSSIQIMPQAESSYIQQPGVDGEIIEDTVYKNRLFNIVMFSELGLTIQEKEILKRDIAQILDATKNNTKKLTFQASSTAFDVKYSGAADIKEGPSYIKATIPLESSPYGYPLFDKEIFGSGLIVNDGDADIGCVHKISSGAINPTFMLGEINYSWNGIVPENTTLVIDHNNYSCYLETIQGLRTNAINKLSGEFQTIPKHSSIVLTAKQSTENYIQTQLKEKILWMGG